jgi:hypothetical protein
MSARDRETLEALSRWAHAFVRHHEQSVVDCFTRASTATDPIERRRWLDRSAVLHEWVEVVDSAVGLITRRHPELAEPGPVYTARVRAQFVAARRKGFRLVPGSKDAGGAGTPPADTTAA